MACLIRNPDSIGLRFRHILYHFCQQKACPCWAPSAQQSILSLPSTKGMSMLGSISSTVHPQPSVNKRHVHAGLHQLDSPSLAFRQQKACSQRSVHTVFTRLPSMATKGMRAFWTCNAIPQHPHGATKGMWLSSSPSLP